MSKNQKVLSNSNLYKAILCLETLTPDSNYEFLSNCKDMKAYRRPSKKNPNYYEYLALGTFPLDPKIMFDLNFDLDYRNSWDSYSKSLKFIKKIDEFTDLVYWRMCYPFPFTDRDYLYLRYCLTITAQELLDSIEKEDNQIDSESKTNNDENNNKLSSENLQKLITILKSNPSKTYHVSSSRPSEDHSPSEDPSDKKAIRVQEFHSICITSSSSSPPPSENNNQCQLFSYMFDNPSGKIPSSFINWITKTAMPKALDQTKKAGDKYQSWKDKNKK